MFLMMERAMLKKEMRRREHAARCAQQRLNAERMGEGRPDFVTIKIVRGRWWPVFSAKTMVPKVGE